MQTVKGDIKLSAKPNRFVLDCMGAPAVAKMVAKAVPVPTGATALLDIGGSHGAYSVALCRRHPGLRGTVLDLPDAVRHAAPLLAEEGMGDRVQHQAGNALTDDLGEQHLDVGLALGETSLDICL